MAKAAIGWEKPFSSMRRFAHQDLIRAAALAEPGREDGGAASQLEPVDRVIATREQYLSRVDAAVNAGCDQPPAGLFPECANRVPELERGVHGAARVVLAWGGKSEGGEHFIAGGFPGPAAICLHRPAVDRSQEVDQLRIFFRLQRFGYSGRIRQVAEKDSGRPALRCRMCSRPRTARFSHGLRHETPSYPPPSLRPAA